jgi:FkbM family methyltransferase
VHGRTASAASEAYDPSPTLVVHCGNRFDAGFNPIKAGMRRVNSHQRLKIALSGCRYARCSRESAIHHDLCPARTGTLVRKGDGFSSPLAAAGHDGHRHWCQSRCLQFAGGSRLVGQTGQVFAYEPGSETRALLERSRELNAAVNLHISPFALSDRDREGRLVFGGSSELNALGDSGAGEIVHITSLDSEDTSQGWPSPDFIKIDAEGEEERILVGGRNFFARHSPLIMFEIKAGSKVNEHLRALFPAIGYRLFRQLGGAPILVPDDAQQPLDTYELNLFAAKPDRVSALSQQGFLVDSIPAWMPNPRPHDAWPSNVAEVGPHAARIIVPLFST